MSHWATVAAVVVVLGLVGSLVAINSGLLGTAPPRDEFAADREGSDAKAVPFDGKRAMGYLKDVCAIGTRISGSEGMAKQQEMLEKHFKDLGGEVSYQKFTATQDGRPVKMANTIVSWNPKADRRVILCCHYDTRPMADQEADRRKWKQPFLSANDGGSGVALLMELAHHMKDLKTKVGVDFVFFDGEEYVFSDKDKYFFGSEHFGKEYKEARKKGGKRVYAGAVLLDMVGGKDARFPVEKNSAWKAGALVKEVYAIAKEQGCDTFKPDEFSKFEIMDDHLALNAAGIPAIDLIDFDYPHWHKLTDVPENCSADSLDQVARVLSVWIQRVK